LQLEIKKYEHNALLYDSVKPDVVVFEPVPVAFEVETGSSDTHPEGLKNKFDRVRGEFGDNYYILVTNWELKQEYKQYGKVITRNEIRETLDRIYNYSP
jgi:hypothetical protein